MNERVKELAGQACDTMHDGDWNIPDEFIERFAKLIVEECQTALSPMLRDMISRGQAVDLIKKHFGIK